MSRQTRLVSVHAVVGILRRDHTLLVAQRPAGKPYSGYWEFPGGKIEQNESALDALKRELHEELGVDILNAEPLFQHTHDYPDKTVLLDLWLVTEFAGEPHGKEDQQLRWATFQDIQALNLLEGNWAIMEKIQRLF